MGRGGVAPSHFFYEMTFGEAAAYIRGMQLRERDEWERTRRIMWAAIMPHSSKELEPEDVLRFSWEEESGTSSVVDKRELERVRNLAKRFKK